MKKKGFTLIALFIVVAVLALGLTVGLRVLFQQADKPYKALTEKMKQGEVTPAEIKKLELSGMASKFLAPMDLPDKTINFCLVGIYANMKDLNGQVKLSHAVFLLEPGEFTDKDKVLSFPHAKAYNGSGRIDRFSVMRLLNSKDVGKMEIPYTYIFYYPNE
ncbi:MAG: type II secretion system protein [Patescibacteria group bacterium]